MNINNKARTICPQVAGIYQTRSKEIKDERYQYIYVSLTRPDEEATCLYAFECDVNGTVNPHRQFSVVFEASEIGVCIKEL